MTKKNRKTRIIKREKKGREKTDRKEREKKAK